MITIVDYGMGNVGSIRNMLRRIGAETEVTGDPERVAAATRLVLPGVGAFDEAMNRIGDLGLAAVLHRKALNEAVPTLGNCLGMQILTDGSEEGSVSGLGWIPGRARRFPPGAEIKVPHMGWNLVEPHTPSPLTTDLPQDSRFYFVHAYYVTTENPAHSILKARHGVEFDAAIQRDNIFGTQFHPEKSHRFGRALLERFVRVDGVTPC